MEYFLIGNFCIPINQQWADMLLLAFAFPMSAYQSSPAHRIVILCFLSSLDLVPTFCMLVNDVRHIRM